MNTRSFKITTTTPGIAIGKAYKISHRPILMARTWIRDIDVSNEMGRFIAAIKKSQKQLDSTISKLCSYHNNEQLKIIESHKMLISDDMILKKTLNEIKKNKINAEWAWEKTMSELRLSMVSLENEYLKDRSQDLEYVTNRVLKNLMGHAELPLKDLPESTILILHNISPAEVVDLPRSRIRGLIIEQGSSISHNAIVARALGITSAFGLTNALNSFEDNEDIILDGSGKIIIASPSLKNLAHYEVLKQRRDAWEKILLKDVDLPATTNDGQKRIYLHANIEILEELESATEHGAEGIGLYRTEYLFLNRSDMPSEEEQLENYLLIAKKFNDKSVTIRTLDLGNDKIPAGFNYEKEKNPALGLKSIRLCLKKPAIFKTQLRALLRASAQNKNLQIMIPMISCVEEIIQTRYILNELKHELKSEGIKHGEPKIGAMIELPSAVIIADVLTKHFDFFSIGTNDLIQYTLGIDRTNEAVNEHYNHFYPSILRSIKHVIQTAKSANIPCSICGEMASDPSIAPLLISWGINNLSMNTVAIPHVKRIIRSLSVEECDKLSSEIEKFTTAVEIETLLKKKFETFAPKRLIKR